MRSFISPTIDSPLGPLTSMPSLFSAYSSKLTIAVLMVRGGGSTVRPMLMALLLLESKTMISWRFPSAAVFYNINIQRRVGAWSPFWQLHCPGGPFNVGLFYWLWIFATAFLIGCRPWPHHIIAQIESKMWLKSNQWLNLWEAPW